MRRVVLGAATLVALGLGCDDPLQRQASVMPVVDEASLRTLPEGVVPVSPVEPAATLEEAVRLPNPSPATRATLDRGREGYADFCSHCHGALGRGRVVVGASLDPAPTDLVEAGARLSDGEMFGIVTFGRGSSPALGPHIAVDERWAIIRYVRTLGAAREGVPPAWGQ